MDIFVVDILVVAILVVDILVVFRPAAAILLVAAFLVEAGEELTSDFFWIGMMSSLSELRALNPGATVRPRSIGASNLNSVSFSRLLHRLTLLHRASGMPNSRNRKFLGFRALLHSCEREESTCILCRVKKIHA